MKEPTKEPITASSIFPCYKEAHEAVESLREALKTLDKIRDELEEARLDKAIMTAYKVSLYLTSIILTLKTSTKKTVKLFGGAELEDFTESMTEELHANFTTRYNDVLFALERLSVYNEVLNKEIMVTIFDYDWMWTTTDRPTKTHQEAKIKTQSCHIQLQSTIKKFELQIIHYLMGLGYASL